MATGEDNTDAAMGVKMANRDRYHPTTTSAETAETAETGIAAATTEVTDSAGDDTAAADSEQTTDAEDGTEDEGGLEIYGDSAYGSGQARADYRNAGHDTMIKPKPLTPAVPGGFTLDDFTINNDAVTCPAGHTRPITPARTVTFGRLCQHCPLRAQCTTAKTGRSMTIHEHQDLLRAARAQATTPQFKRDYPTRSNIERTIAHTATQNGRRIKLRYLGTTKNNAWLHTRAAALNLRTLLSLGLTRTNGAWALT